MKTFNNERCYYLDTFNLWECLIRQKKTIIAVFTLVTTISIIYITSRPTLYQSQASVMIGELLFFETQPIESQESIKYRYSTVLEIRPIKNTRIIEVISTSTNSEESKHQVNNTIEKIINEHASIFDKKRSDFLKYANEIYNKDLAPNKKKYAQHA